MILLLPSQSTVLHAYAVLLGMTPGNAAFKDHQAYIASQTNAGYLSAVESYFAGTSTASLASTALTNLGLTSVITQADAEAFLNANPGNRAGALVAAGQWLYSYSGTDAVTLAAKAAYVNAIESSYAYSNNAVNVNGKAWVGYWWTIHLSRSWFYNLGWQCVRRHNQRFCATKPKWRQRQLVLYGRHN
ncbi:MAG: hypothetical protein IPH37_09505 [Burkholderiales bacterium]|nr:hypothetical protein [Burkholderiales bacterium]